jgi:glycosyltransferase involved in cell wall biosynthesis
MNGLNFCFLTTFYPPYSFGGDAIAIQRLARGLVGAGHRVTVIHDVDAFRTLSRTPVSVTSTEPEGLEVVSLRSSLGAMSVLLTQQLGRPVVHGNRIARVLREGRFDVLNFHNVSLVGGPGLLKYGRALKIYMAHEHWLVCPTHVLWRHRRELCTKRECIRCQLAYRRPPQLWRQTGYLERQLAHVDTFIAMSEFSRDKHREFGFKRDMEVLPAFIPESSKAELADDGDSPSKRPYFLFVGRLEQLKGVQDVIPLFADFEDADLLVAGDGDYAGELHEQARGIPRVHFVGRVPSSELARYFRHAIALIAPSLCFETFGVILLEAFRQSTPVIARDLGPFPEIIATSGGGELFTTRDSLLAAMRRMQGDKAYRNRLGQLGYEAFRKHWDERVVVPRYLDIVRRTAERKRGTGAVPDRHLASTGPR